MIEKSCKCDIVKFFFENQQHIERLFENRISTLSFLITLQLPAKKKNYFFCFFFFAEKKKEFT